MARKIEDENDEDIPFPDEEEPQPENPRPNPIPIEVRDFAIARRRMAEAVGFWQIGNEKSKLQKFAEAEDAYEKCLRAVINFFSSFYPPDSLNLNFPAGLPTSDKIAILVKELFKVKDRFPALWEKLRQRREAITLSELQTLDWGSSDKAVNTFFLPRTHQQTSEIVKLRQRTVEYILLLLATVLVPISRAEMNGMRRNWSKAIEDYERLLTPYRETTVDAPLIWLTNDFIERPFILMSLGEVRLGLAEDQFKAAAQGKADEALATYKSILDLFNDYGAYAERIIAAQKSLSDDAAQLPTLPADRKDLALKVFGKNVTVPGIEANAKEFPGMSQTKAPAESWLQFIDTVDGEVVTETNPRIYALLLNVQARALQIENGFNYLGYDNNYIPPWRFQFLLERARYFSEHAKNAQRDYLNFLNNAEHEEFQELSAAQAVEMEKANVRVESTRVNQVGLEVAAAQQSKELAELTRANSIGRFQDYKAFDKYADEQDRKSRKGGILSGVGGIISGSLNPTNPGAGAVAGFLSAVGADMQQQAQLGIANRQRELEKGNLGRAIAEAKKAADIAKAQFEVAKQGLVVAGLQRQAALLRHEFAIQNLQYLRNRTLNAEQWFRLANAIRSVADTYLRYAIELAFLAEQAYEFEADKRINVIRFNYDQSEQGAFLASDFLLRDLDTIEQDFVVNQRERQQQVRYVLSMARVFPAALEELRETGKVNLILRLEQIEKRFPGIYNARIGMIDVLPVALLDSTRFSLNLTHAGSGQLRIKGQPDVPIGGESESVLNVSDLPLSDYDWSKTPKELWPVKLVITEPETAVFSGLTRQDAASAFPVASSGQRNAFEGRPLAGGWQIDMSTRENQLVPDSLADLLITFTVSGYYDSGLRDAIESSQSQTTALTTFLSAQQIFPDGFYDFIRTGRMVWKVPGELLTLRGELGRLRNIGFSLRPGVSEFHFSRLMTSLQMNFRIDEENGVASGLSLFTFIPEISFTQTAPLTVTVKAILNAATELAWDFGDGTPTLASAEGIHVYTKPGRYVIRLRCVANDVLSDYRSSVVVSRHHKLGDPLIVYPSILFDNNTKTITGTAVGDVPETSRILWRVGRETAEGNSANFTLKPGFYTLDFAAVRKLNFKAYGVQRYLIGAVALPLQGLSATTNRTFDNNGMETNGTGTPTPLPTRNELAKRLFDNGEISPLDDWTLELIPEEILGVPAGTLVGAEQPDLSQIQDVVLSMEYDHTPSYF